MKPQWTVVETYGGYTLERDFCPLTIDGIELCISDKWTAHTICAILHLNEDCQRA